MEFRWLGWMSGVNASGAHEGILLSMPTCVTPAPAQRGWPFVGIVPRGVPYYACATTWPRPTATQCTHASWSRAATRPGQGASLRTTSQNSRGRSPSLCGRWPFHDPCRRPKRERTARRRGPTSSASEVAACRTTHAWLGYVSRHPTETAANALNWCDMSWWHAMPANRGMTGTEWRQPRRNWQRHAEGTLAAFLRPTWQEAAAERVEWCRARPADVRWRMADFEGAPAPSEDAARAQRIRLRDVVSDPRGLGAAALACGRPQVFVRGRSHEVPSFTCASVRCNRLVFFSFFLFFEPSRGNELPCVLLVRASSVAKFHRTQLLRVGPRRGWRDANNDSDHVRDHGSQCIREVLWRILAFAEQSSLVVPRKKARASC